MKPSYLVTIDLSSPEAHRAKITISAASDELPPLLQFPVWTPGSYLIREYSRHITRMSHAEKVAKNQWRLIGKPKSVSYEVYCFEKTVRTSFLDATHACLVGATLLPLLHAPFELELRIPRKWAGVSSALKLKKSAPGVYRSRVENDDDWLDKPIIAWALGYGGESKFRVGGITHHVAWVGLGCSRTLSEINSAFEKICRATLQMFGDAPFREYWFLLHFGPKLYGGLEHRDSQLSQFDGSTLHESPDWNRFIKLIAHEYFHAWNVKSIRPLALGPFDYFNENYTHDIWFSEGLTDYFDDEIALKAGLFSEEDLHKARLRDVSLFPDGHPGHFRRSLAESSFDAWIRYYRPDEDSVNTDVSYYGKGAVLGWCWDAHLRKKSKGKWTLAKLMREFYREFGIDAYESLKGAKPGFTRSELLTFAEEKTGIAQKRLVDSWVVSRKPLPWREAARFFRINWKENVTSPALHFLGMQLKWEGKATVSGVLANGAAETAGIAPFDELIAINGFRVSESEKFKISIKNAMAEGKTLDLLFSRGDKIMNRQLRWRKHDGMGMEVVPK